MFIKAGDGDDTWSQFTPELVGELKSRGLDVCAWQFVYGNDPAGEARVGAAAADDGADCLVIDAEAEYEGRYAAATLYIERLRAAVGADFPLGLAALSLRRTTTRRSRTRSSSRPARPSSTCRRSTGRRSGPASTRR